jgi:hypothetical protein
MIQRINRNDKTEDHDYDNNRYDQDPKGHTAVPVRVDDDWKGDGRQSHKGRNSQGKKFVNQNNWRGKGGNRKDKERREEKEREKEKEKEKEKSDAKGKRKGKGSRNAQSENLERGRKNGIRKTKKKEEEVCEKKRSC